MQITKKTFAKFFAERSNKAFTLVEVCAAVVIVGFITASVMIVIHNCIDATIDLKLRGQAFEIAREKMELVLASDKLKEQADSGISDRNPEIDWEIVIEADTIADDSDSSQIWLKAISTANYTDSKGEMQNVELVHWVAGLSPQQMKQIKADQMAGVRKDGEDPEGPDDPDGPQTELDQKLEDLETGKITLQEFLDWVFNVYFK